MQSESFFFCNILLHITFQGRISNLLFVICFDVCYLSCRVSRRLIHIRIYMPDVQQWVFISNICMVAFGGAGGVIYVPRHLYLLNIRIFSFHKRLQIKIGLMTLFMILISSR